MKIDHVPARGGGSQLSFEPHSLHGSAGNPIRLANITIDSEEVYRALHEVVIPFVAGQGEIVQIWLHGSRDQVPVVATQSGKEAVSHGA